MRPRAHDLPAAALVALLLGGCAESPFAPAPSAASCGTADFPCPFDCSAGCAAQAVDLVAACMQTLEGSLDSARTRCTFSDGSVITFAWPVPATGADLDSRTWQFTVQRGGVSCLSIKADPLPWRSWRVQAAADLTWSTGQYRQEVWMGQDDGGASVTRVRRVAMRCPGGKVYDSEGRDPCTACEGADCRKLPLVEVHAAWDNGALGIELTSAERVTPLFTCR